MKRLLLFSYFILLSSSVFAECARLNYKEGTVYEKSPRSLVMAVSVPFDRLTKANLICLGGQLGREFPKQDSVMVFVFSSPSAASRYALLNESAIPARDKELHAEFVRNRNNREEYLQITPFGGPSGSHFDTRIDLLARVIPPCRLELQQRCLLASDDIFYPGGYHDTTAGAVTLMGTVERQGNLDNVRVVTSSFVNQPAKESFTMAAVSNLQSWRFEPRPSKNSIRITYSYRIDASLEQGQGDVQIRLPDNVVIRFNPYQR